MDNLPAPLRPRHNGWTAERQAAFIHALGDTASVTAAAARVGMSPQAAHWLRRQPAAVDFRAAWAAALALAWNQVEATALERVINGETETIERDGVRITRHRPCDPRLHIHMVERAILAREKAEAKAAKANQPSYAKVMRLRDDIRALAAGEDIDLNPCEPPEPPVIDETTAAARRLDDLVRGFVDRPDCDEHADRTGGVMHQNLLKQENKENNAGHRASVTVAGRGETA